MNPPAWNTAKQVRETLAVLGHVPARISNGGALAFADGLRTFHNQAVQAEESDPVVLLSKAFLCNLLEYGHGKSGRSQRYGR